jgi:hypothetical protein
MGFSSLKNKLDSRCGLGWVLAFLLCASTGQLLAQQTSPPDLGSKLPDAPGESGATQPPSDSLAPGSVTGIITDTDRAAIPAARITLEDVDSKASRSTASDGHGAFLFSPVAPGKYVVEVHAPGFSPWKIHDIIVVHVGEDFVVPEVELGVESINTTVNAISMEDLAEQQITAEEHQRILGVLPNFFVSYVSNAAPLTRKQKFKLAVVVSRDPLTFFTTGVTAGIEQWQGDFSGYGQEFSGYARRYGATYGDRLSSTFLGAALLPSLLHQDPRYFYRGHGPIIVRALYAVSTVAVCKGDNGHWQPNYSNVFGNLGAAAISSLYYPQSDKHDIQVTVDNTLLGVAEGAFGTLFQEFLLRHLTHGGPAKASANHP